LILVSIFFFFVGAQKFNFNWLRIICTAEVQLIIHVLYVSTDDGRVKVNRLGVSG